MLSVSLPSFSGCPRLEQHQQNGMRFLYIILGPPFASSQLSLVLMSTERSSSVCLLPVHQASPARDTIEKYISSVGWQLGNIVGAYTAAGAAAPNDMQLI